MEVEDEADVIQRVTSATCLDLAIAKVADLSFADEVTADGDGGKGSVGTMTLQVRTTGKPGPTLVIDTISGNPVLSPGELGVFTADLTITGDQPSQDVPMPVTPTRCDAHAFGESGSFAAFAFNVHLDGVPGQFILRLGDDRGGQRDRLRQGLVRLPDLDRRRRGLSLATRSGLMIRSERSAPYSGPSAPAPPRTPRDRGAQLPRRLPLVARPQPVADPRGRACSSASSG